MRTIESLRREIFELMRAMNQNTVELNRCQKQNAWLTANELLHARIEIYKSIAHRQGLIIEMQSAELKYVSGGKVAA